MLAVATTGSCVGPLNKISEMVVDLKESADKKEKKKKKKTLIRSAPEGP